MESPVSGYYSFADSSEHSAFVRYSHGNYWLKHRFRRTYSLEEQVVEKEGVLIAHFLLLLVLPDWMISSQREILAGRVTS